MEGDRTWEFAEPCVGCICCRTQEKGPVAVQEQHCIAASRFGIAVEACSFGLQGEAESSLSAGGGCCSGREA
jgi:hypothetical protein